LALALIIFNFSKVNFDSPFEGNSSVALIGVVCGFCAIFLMVIFRLSKMVEEKTKDK
jgi:H+/Cl- antiporter ClcA